MKKQKDDYDRKIAKLDQQIWILEEEVGEKNHSLETAKARALKLHKDLSSLHRQMDANNIVLSQKEDFELVKTQ